MNTIGDSGSRGWVLRDCRCWSEVGGGAGHSGLAGVLTGLLSALIAGSLVFTRCGALWWTFQSLV